jgi:Flp pilus assembly protein TadG
MKIRNKRAGRRGALTTQVAIILVPVIFGLMGFAVDFGRIYLVRGELNQAASAMALAAASQLNGTAAATDSAQNAANALNDPSQSDSNTYNFGSLVVGQGNSGTLTATTPLFSFFTNLGDVSSGGTAADGTTAHYVSVNLAADAPLTFWSLFSFGASHKASIGAMAVAGLSAPLCTACGITPFALAPVNAADTQDFGFVAGNWYTLGYVCNGAPTPAVLTGTTAGTARVPYLIIDRSTSGTLSPDQQLFESAAQGLLPSTDPTQACSMIGGTEVVWAANPTVQACAAGAANAAVRNAMCGLSARFTTLTPATCTAVTDVTDIAAIYPQDTDLNTYADFPSYQAGYQGNNRRLVTLPIVDALSATAAMTVQGFRQFLLQPTSGASPPSNTPSDANGRFLAMYLGNVAPVKQGRFDGACGITTGPGKVVLQQ